METLKLLVIFIILAVGINGDEESHREGRHCGHHGPGHTHGNRLFPNRRNHHGGTRIFKPIIHGNGRRTVLITPGAGGAGAHNFNFEPEIQTETEFQQLNPSHQEETGHELHEPLPEPLPEVGAGKHDDNHDLDLDIDVRNSVRNPGSKDLGSAPSILIDKDGQIRIQKRSAQWNRKSFNAEDDDELLNFANNRYFIDEDLDDIYKSFRTARSGRPRPRPSPGSQHLATGWSGGLQQSGPSAEALQVIAANQGSQSYDFGELAASGGEVYYAGSSTSGVDGTGHFNGAGVIEASQKKGSGDANSYQGVNVGNGAGASSHLDALLSGLEVSLSNSGSTGASGTGSVTSSGSTTVTVNGNGPGWRAGASGPGQGANVGNGAYAGNQFDANVSGLSASAANSGSSNVYGSGTISASGNTNVQGGAGSGWKPQ